MDADLRRRVLLLNTMCMVLVPLIIIYIFVFGFVEPRLSLITVPVLLWYVAVMFLSKRGRFGVARQLFAFGQQIAIVLFVQLFGPASDIQNIIFPGTIYALLLFNLRQWPAIIPGVLWSILCFYGLIATDFTPIPGLEPLDLAADTVRYFSYSFNGIAFILLLASMIYMSYFSARADAEREATIKQLIEANETKSRFLANMSHELRTPLNAIIGYAELIQETVSDGDTSKILQDTERIDQSGRHLLALVNDILDLSKIEASQMTLHVEPVSLAALLDEISAQVEPLVAARHNRWGAKLDPALDVIHTDRMRLKQILLNLISNAAKFTTDGAVTLTVAPDGPGHITFAVSDTGVGIAREQQERIFEAFVQADDSFTRTHQGTGLGLTLSRRFSTLLGGTLTLESVVGQGSTFTTRLPRAAAQRR